MSGAMLRALQVVALLLVAATAPGVVLTRSPVRQTVVVSFYGLALAVMFALFAAPDVALAQVAVGTIALPLVLLLSLARMRRKEPSEEGDA
ncbi:MAG TPA: DUF4040 domain-containing protein [Minicystis sp.]|nr:DUF4040 domain-containing protein [Minicystis sp.]